VTARGIGSKSISLFSNSCRAILAGALLLLLSTAANATVAVTAIAISPIETQAFNGAVATFTSDDVPAQPVGNYSAVIDWGDLTSSAGVITQPGGAGTAFQVAGGHTYAEDGLYTLTVTVTDTFAGTSVPASTPITVGESLLSMTSTSPLAAVEGTVFSGQTATFSDPPNTDPVGNYTATIDWGDGSTSTAVITQPGGAGTAYSISGTHTYADEGTFTVNTTAAEAFEPSFTVSVGSQMTVAEGDVLTPVPLSFVTTVGVPFTGPTATFTDTYTGNTASDFTATINWGDGTTTPGIISGGGGTWTVSGTHTYATVGPFVVSVTLTDDAPGTATATAVSAATVAAVPIAQGIPTLTEWGLALLVVLTALTAFFVLRRREG